jgi:exopolyphosphatase/guanosine-5'-triphosphate,3'-diphosphate pyrophosphatase
LARLEAGSDHVGDEFVLPRDAAEEIFRTVATEAAGDRAYNPGIPGEHVDTVVAACCIVLTVMRRLHLDQVTIA